MAVNVKMGVDIGGFTSGIKEGQSQLKTLKAEMKATEAEFKATGNSEQALANKTKTLTQQLKTQQNIMKQAEGALKAMTDAGIKPTDQAYQKMYVQMLNAKAGMNETQAALNGLSGAQEQAATGAQELSSSLNSIGKKVSLDAVIGGIDRITSGLESAARKAADVGKAIWDEIMDSARWADDTATMAQMYGIDLDTFLRMQKLVTNGMDTSVEAILGSQSKLERNLAAGSKTVVEAMQAMGLATTEWAQVEGQSGPSVVMKDSTDMFWEAGKAILAMKDAYKQEEYAQALFGRSWHELVPLFTQFKDKESFTEALNSVNVESEDTVTKLAKLNDKIGELEGNFKTLERTVLGELAEPLTKGAEALSGMLSEIMKFLDTEDGQKMLEDMGTAVSGLFDDLGKIDPKDVVKGFTDVFNTVVGSLQWLVEHKDELSGALTFIVGGWAVAELSGGALQVLQLINGLRSLGLIGGGAAASGAGAKGIGGGLGGTLLHSALPALGMDALVTGAALLPAIIANNADWANAEQTRARQLAAAGGSDSPNAQWLTRAANALGLQRDAQGNLIHGAMGQSVWGNMADTEQALMDLSSRQNQQMAELQSIIHSFAPTTSSGQDTWNELMRFWGGEEMDQSRIVALAESVTKAMEKQLTGEKAPKVDVTPVVLTEVAQEQLNAAGLTVTVRPQIGWGDYGGAGAGGSGWKITQRANGLPFVPYDGYLASLHRGEQIVPARAAASRNYSSNLYVESMYMNNGVDAQGLAQAMAAEQRRTSSGYGS